MDDFARRSIEELLHKQNIVIKRDFIDIESAKNPGRKEFTNMLRLLERAGWDALTAGQAHTAAESFRAALAADPRNARLYLGAGIAAFLERRDGDAGALRQRAEE